jgi:2-C-methyl-D-erythritol 4-phosphate cytidylyltransferase
LANDAGYWALVPAAGSGRRMGADVPKQYLPLSGLPVLAHTLIRLAGFPGLRGIVVGLAPDDPYWPQVEAQVANLPVPLHVCEGGAERADTVINALRHLRAEADAGDWVLVHDAARPCVRHEDIHKLIEAAADGEDGAILALPVSDTIKRCDPLGWIESTVDRSTLWRALTPQLFPMEPLLEALEAAQADGVVVTDEAMAIERSGRRPRCVPAHADNIKITYNEDLALADFYLAEQAAEAPE